MHDILPRKTQDNRCEAPTTSTNEDEGHSYDAPRLTRSRKADGDGRYPPRFGACDRCDGELYQRDDDRDDRIATRLDQLAKEVAPVADYYRREGLLHNVDGTGSRDDVSRRIRASLPA